MNVDAIQIEADKYLTALRSLIETQFKADGNTAETSQRINLLNHLNELEYCFNGVKDGDLKNP